MLTLRPAIAADAALVLSLIRELAEYERLLHECVASEADIRRSLFGPEAKAFCIIAEWEGVAAGFALCFYNYSTFLGRAGIYIEDLFVRPEFRRKGIARALFQYLAKRACDEGCGRVEWWVLDWNQPAIEFYKSLGAVAMDEWTVQRLSGDALVALASNRSADSA